MPYVKSELRSALEFLNPLPSNAGELNYAISHLCHRYISEMKKGVSYANCNEVIGVLDCAKMEFYRTVVAPYEDTKIQENGAVSDLDAPFLTTVNGQTTAYSIPDTDALALSIANSIQSVLGKPAKQPANSSVPAEDSSITSAPSAENKPANTSKVRRPAVVLGPPAGIGDAALPNVPVAPAAPAKAPKGHSPAKLDKRVASVWDDAVKGNGEDDIDI